MPAPTDDTVRLTIRVPRDVYDTFSSIAGSMNTGIGRAMAEWLNDSSDAAKLIAAKLEEARSAPLLVAREMHAYALGLADETRQVLQTVRENSRKQRTAKQPSGDRPDGASGGPIPPSCNTGGKVPSARGNTDREPAGKRGPKHGS